MKKFLCIVMLLVFIGNLSAVDLTFVLPNDKVEEYIENYVAVYPNSEQVDNPDYIDHIETPEEPLSLPKYTDAQWVKEHIKRTIANIIRRGHIVRQRQEETVINTTDIATD